MSVQNNISLIGNVGGDPKTITTQSGTVITEFRLATNEYYRDKEGNKQTKTEWHKVKAFGKLAEIFQQHLKSGSKIAVSGKMAYNKWVDKFEQKRNTAEVIVSEFTFLGDGNKSEARASDPVTSNGQAQQKAQPAGAKDESLPF